MIGRLLPAPGPARRLAWATLVNTTGNGIYLTGGALFLTRSAGIPAAQVGLGLTIAGIVSLAGGVVVGDHADRRGAREVYIVALLVEAVAMVGFAFTRNLLTFVIAAAVGGIGDVGAGSSKGALVALIGGDVGRVALRAQLRAITNVGVSAGALIAGIVLAIDARDAYVGMMLLDALTYVAAAVLVARVPSYPPTRAPLANAEDDGDRWVAVHDRPYLATTAVNAVLHLNYAILTIGLPLWVSQHTAAPRWLVAPLILINTVMIVVLQVRASQGVATPEVAARALRRAGVVFAVAWVLFGLAGETGAVLAVALLVAGCLVHATAELWQAAGSFELSFSLARADAQGQYQGVFGMGNGLADAVAPLLATGVCVAGGLAGWAGVGLLLAATGALAPVTVRWAQATRT